MTRSNDSQKTQNTIRHTSPPPKVERHWTRGVVVIAAGITLAGMMLIILINLDRGTDTENSGFAEQNGDIIIIEPRELRPEDEHRDANDQPSVIAREGGWIQVADPDNPSRVAQQYSFSNIDPTPEGRSAGWVQLKDPRAQLFLSDDRVVTLQGTTSVVHSPNRALEYGSIFGDVIIRLYETSQRRPIDESVDVPILTIKTEEAEFDNFNNEIKCAGAVDISSPRVEMPGRTLRLQINDRDDFVQLLRIEDVDYLRVRDLPDEEVVAHGPLPPRSVRLASFDPQDERKRRRQRDRDAQASPKDTPADVQFYRLILDRNVLIRKGLPENRQRVDGETLHAVFSTESRGLTEGLASGFNNSMRRGNHRLDPMEMYASNARPMSYERWLIMSMLAAQDGVDTSIPEPNETDAIITFDGPLEIRPLVDDAENRPSKDDSIVSVFGSPAVLDDRTESLHATCAEVRYSSNAQRIDLIAPERDGVTIDSPDLDGTGMHFWMSTTEQRGGFEGPGALLGQSTPDPDDTNDVAPEEADEQDGEQDSGSSTADDPPPATAPPAQENETTEQDGDDELLEDMRITWERGVDLKFSEAPNAESMGNLEKIIFTGDVDVVSKDGTIACQSLEVQVTADENGDLAPDRMIASGDIRTGDVDRTMWADSLIVTFDDAPVIEGDAPDVGSTMTPDRIGKSAKVKTLLATGNVQVLLSDGSRAFADRMFGDGVSESIELTGDNVIVVSGQLIIDRGRKIVFDQGAQTANAPGAGQARIYNKPLPTLKDGRMQRPDIKPLTSEKPLVQARWNEQMTFDNARNDGAGAVDFRGKVEAEAAPNAFEKNTMTGDVLTLDFAMLPEDSLNEDEKFVAEESNTPESMVARGNRRLAMFTARGDAKITNVTWKNEEHSGTPRTFYVAGDFVQYNDRTFESRVIGKGTFLIEDLETEGIEDNAMANATPFGGKGATAFEWTRQFTMTRRADERFDVLMHGDVVGRHLNLDNEPSTITGQTITAVLNRRAGEVPLAERDEAVPSPGFDMGGTMELRRMGGEGAMKIQANNREIECEIFDYDVERAIATATARPGGMIRAKTKGDDKVIQARSVRWMMDPRIDAIQIRNVSGGGGGGG